MTDSTDSIGLKVKASWALLPNFDCHPTQIVIETRGTRTGAVSPMGIATEGDRTRDTRNVSSEYASDEYAPNEYK